MAKRTAATASGSTDHSALIAEAAYYRAERRGFEPGYEMADWLEAEKEIESIFKKPRPRKTAAKKPSAAGKPKKSARN